LLNTRIIKYTLAVAGALLIGSQAMAQGGPPAGPPGGLGVNVVNTPLPVTVTNPTIPPSTVSLGNSAALAAAIAQALRGTPVSFKLVASKPATPYLVPVGQLLLMEYASGSCVDPSIAQLQVTTRGVETIHNFGFQVQPVPGTLGQVGQFGHLVKIYADPGTQVFFLGVLGCEITVSGQLIIP